MVAAFIIMVFIGLSAFHTRAEEPIFLSHDNSELREMVEMN